MNESFIFYALLVAAVIVVFKLMMMMRPTSKDTQAVHDEARHIARRLSKGKYYVKTVGLGFTGVVLTLQTADLERKQESLAFKRRHPDRKRAQQLRKLEVIGFQFSEWPLEDVNKGEICAYLRLVSD